MNLFIGNDMGYVINYKRWVIEKRMKRIRRNLRVNSENYTPILILFLEDELKNLQSELDNLET